MEQTKRSQYAHYIDTAPSTTSPDWEIEGNGVDALSLAFNPQIDTFKSILSDVSDSTFNGYQIQSSVSGKRIYKDDPIYEFLNTYRKTAKAVETSLLELDLADGTGTPATTYPSIKYSILIVINEFLGENATISYDMYVKGEPVQGTSVITSGKPVFTESV